MELVDQSSQSQVDEKTLAEPPPTGNAERKFSHQEVIAYDEMGAPGNNSVRARFLERD